MVFKFPVIDGPSERKLFFSLSDRSYRVEFEIDAPELLKSYVQIKTLAETGHPGVWAWRGHVRVKNKQISDFTAWGLFDLHQREGVAFVELPEAPDDIRNDILTGRCEGFRPIEYELPKAQVIEHLAAEGPDEKRLKRCKEIIVWDGPPWNSFGTESGPKVSMRFTKLEQMHGVWFFDAEIGSKLSGGVYRPIKGLWRPKNQTGFIIDGRDDFPFRSLDRVKTLV